jgi:hypothetical protein
VRRATSAWESPFSNRTKARKRRFSIAAKSRRALMLANIASLPAVSLYYAVLNSS